jgi:hypothetical protein
MIKSPEFSVCQSAAADSSAVFWAGILVATGAGGVVVAGVFYALSPAPAALPMPNIAFAKALAGTIAGRAAMIAAGTIGVVFDVVLAAGALVMMVFRKPAGLQIERAGWAFVTISVLIFVMVDSLSAGVLPPIAALDGAAATFAGFKLLFDMLFILGTIAFGLGAPAILTSEMKSESPLLPKPLLWIGIFAAFAGLVSGFLYFANVSLPQIIGVSIAVGTLTFAIYGVQIARSARQTVLRIKPDGC